VSAATAPLDELVTVGVDGVVDGVEGVVDGVEGVVDGFDGVVDTTPLQATPLTANDVGSTFVPE